MGDEPTVDRNDPELKYLTVEKNQFNDPATQAEWTQKRLVWVPHEAQVSKKERKKKRKEILRKERKHTQDKLDNKGRSGPVWGDISRTRTKFSDPWINKARI